MQKIYLFFSLFITISSFASELGCSKNGAALILVNGVNTTPFEAFQNKKGPHCCGP